MTPKLRAAGLLGYVEVARGIGVDPYALLRRIGIDPRRLEDTEWRIPALSTIELLEETAELAQRHDIGVLIARNRSFAHFGPIGLLLQHLDTPGKVVEAIGEFRHLMGDAMTIAVEGDDELALIRLDSLIEGIGFQLISMCVAIAFRVITDASGGIWQPECVHFTRNRPTDISTFTNYFRADIQFGSTFDGFSCPRRSLDLHNPNADSLMARHARNLLGLMNFVGHDDNALDHTKYSISLLMASGSPTLAAVASNLGISSRTLQRALEREGKSFAGLLNETRRQLAVRYLGESALSIGSIAGMVGYSSGSTFTRWFTGEFNETPLAFRARMDRRRRQWGIGDA